MTFRQVHALLKVIGRADLVEFYMNIMSYATATGTAKNLPSIDEFLALASGEAPQVFDEKTDKILEERALRQFEEKRQRHLEAKPNGK